MASFLVSWSINGPNIVSQTLQYREFGDTIWIDAATLEPEVTFYMVSGLPDGVYEFRVLQECNEEDLESPVFLAGSIACPELTVESDGLEFDYEFTSVYEADYTVELYKDGVFALSDSFPSATGAQNGTFTISTPGMVELRMVITKSTYTKYCPFSEAIYASCPTITDIIATLS